MKRQLKHEEVTTILTDEALDEVVGGGSCSPVAASCSPIGASCSPVVRPSVDIWRQTKY